MNCHPTRPGFILIFTLMLLSLATIIVTRVYYKSSGLSAFVHASLGRQQAQLLAISGLELAKSKLEGKTFAVDEYLTKIFPVLNIWQTVDLTDRLGGETGKLELYISCELGKLNPNQLYDFKKRTFKPNLKPALQKLFAKNPKLANLPDLLEKALQQRREPLNDLSELLADSAFQQLFQQQLYRLPADSQVGGDQSATAAGQREQAGDFYLTDLLTLYNPQPVLWSAFLAQDYLNLLQLNTAKTSAARQQGLQQLFQAVTQAKKALTQEAALSMLYSAPPIGPLAPEVAQLLVVNFTPPVTFTVLVQATIGLNIARIFAIITADSVEDAHMSYKLVRLYWI